MKRLLTATAMSLALLAGTMAHAGPVQPYDKTSALSVVVTASLHSQMCSTEQPEAAKLLVKFSTKQLADDHVGKEEIEAEAKIRAEEMFKEGVSTWCRQMDTVMGGMQSKLTNDVTIKLMGKVLGLN